MNRQSQKKVALPLMLTKTLSFARFADFTGFVLAGGASQRMGRPKASLRLDGESMLERQIRVLRSVARRVAVVGCPAGCLDKLDVPVIPDAVAKHGPLGGIYTALLQTQTQFSLVIGCDLPFVSRNLLACLMLRARADESGATVPCSPDGRLQPLCAVYRRAALYAVRTRLALGLNKPSGFFPLVRFTAIPWRDLADAGVRPSEFENMNTPEDYEYARRRIEGPVAVPACSKRTPL
jgi:molybdenum cofactor guanylyltransferase